jgi:hypothetical protein
MADDQKPKRTTSFAKEIDPDEHARSLKAEFDRAKEATERSREQQQTQQRRPHAPRNEPHLRPGGVQQRRVDQKIDRELLTKADRDAQALNDAVETSRKQQKQLDLDNERQKDRDDRDR